MFEFSDFHHKNAYKILSKILSKKKKSRRQYRVIRNTAFVKYFALFYKFITLNLKFSL